MNDKRISKFKHKLQKEQGILSKGKLKQLTPQQMQHYAQRLKYKEMHMQQSKDDNKSDNAS